VPHSPESRIENVGASLRLAQYIIGQVLDLPLHSRHSGEGRNPGFPSPSFHASGNPSFRHSGEGRNPGLKCRGEAVPRPSNNTRRSRSKKAPTERPMIAQCVSACPFLRLAAPPAARVLCSHGYEYQIIAESPERAKQLRKRDELCAALTGLGLCHMNASRKTRAYAPARQATLSHRSAAPNQPARTPKDLINMEKNINIKACIFKGITILLFSAKKPPHKRSYECIF